MSDDRFEDLGGERRRAEIGDELAERDRTHPEQPRRPEVPNSKVPPSKRTISPGGGALPAG